MRILISHVNFPAQFRRLLVYWLEKGHDLKFVCRQTEWHAQIPENLDILSYSVDRCSSGPHIHPYVRRFERAIFEGQEVYRRCRTLLDSDWVPDVVITHLGFGNGFFLSDLFPCSRRIGLLEWFYNSSDSDVDFLKTSSVSENHKLQLRVWNSEVLLEMSSLDAIVTPTYWQRDQFPLLFRDKISVIHEGVDCNLLRSIAKSESSRSEFKSLGVELPEGAEVLTYVSRCFEEYRGFPQVMDIIAKLQSLRPNLHFLLVGTDGTAYGPPRSDGKPWSEWSKSNFDLDPHRVHWLGSLQEDDYHKVLSVSDVHLYLTIPFILSWSFLEAMASGCKIIASRTQPVTEVSEHNISALHVDFYDVDGFVDQVLKVLDNKNLSDSLSLGAMKAAQNYSLEQGCRLWDGLLTGS